MPTELAKTYSPADVEPTILQRWADARAYHATPDAPGKPYSIVIPPPNVTAALHMGHALNNTIQDVLIRYHRMRGDKTLWMPGTDHAGIATQTVVDKRLQQEGKPSLKDYKKIEADGPPGTGREQFIDKVQAWKDEYEQRILDQLKAMGCSCDFDRTRFTMDDVCAAAVREAFFQLFKDGLIYRGKRLVNWDPVTQTALADDEVEMQEIDGHFWYMQYPLEDGSGHVTVATTRPETMLGDTAVAVNPNDPKRAHLIGKRVKLPIVNRIIPIIGDEYVVIPDPDSDDAKARYASGFLKVTPAHDPNDYDIGQRHRLGTINVMAPDASISLDHGWLAIEPDIAGKAEAFLKDQLVGKSREDARKAIVAWFKQNSLLEDVKPYRHAVGHSYRSHVPIEPYLSDQWYVKVTDDKLKGAALRAMAQTSASQVSPKTMAQKTATQKTVGQKTVTQKTVAQASRLCGGTEDGGTEDGGTEDGGTEDGGTEDGGTEDGGTGVGGTGVGGTGVPPVHTTATPNAISSSLSRKKRNLPHWQQGGSTYFITFRLAAGQLSQAERTIVLNACRHWHEQRMWLHVAVVMPDHVHLLMTPMKQDDDVWHDLSTIMHSIKSYSAHRINRLRDASGPIWQDESYDRIVRDQAEFEEKWNYIWENPVRAGLVADPAGYQWLWQPLVEGGTHRPEACATEGNRPEACATGTQSNGQGQLRFYPQRYARTFEQWHENIRDWCISRQLWWGHRIPVWHILISDEACASENPEEELTEAFNEFARRTNTVGEITVKRIGAAFAAVCVRTVRAEQALNAFTTFFRSMSLEHSPGNEPEVLQHIPGFPEADDAADRLYYLIFEITQDPDVLDTWFSSALWPLSTMGWPVPGSFPDEIPEGDAVLDTWNPTNVLCTAREIITLWVSRMVMFNLYFRDCLPFYDVFIHAMIQDGHGQKMSKSLGNGVDPMDIIHSHGSDAMRYTLTAMTTHTQDVRMPVDMVCPHTGKMFTPQFIKTNSGHLVAAPVQDSPFAKGKKMVSSFGIASGQARLGDEMPAARNTSEKFDLGRNFANKMWNAVRFALSNLEESGVGGQASGGRGQEAGVRGQGGSPDEDSSFITHHSSLADQWILSRLVRTLREVEGCLERYEFAGYAQAMYDFFWRDLCDWYIEAVKPTAKRDPRQQRVLATCVDASLRMLHPIMPFITEQLFAALNEVYSSRGVSGVALPEGSLLIRAPWPAADDALMDEQVEADFTLLQSVVQAVRQTRTQYKVPPRQNVTVSLRAGEALLPRIEAMRDLLQTLATVTCQAVAGDVNKPGDAAVALVGQCEVYLHGLVDADTERTRLEKRAAELQKQIKTLEGRLGNEKYVNNAPAHLVEESRQQLENARQEADAVAKQLQAVG